MLVRVVHESQRLSNQLFETEGPATQQVTAVSNRFSVPVSTDVSVVKLFSPDQSWFRNFQQVDRAHIQQSGRSVYVVVCAG